MKDVKSNNFIFPIFNQKTYFADRTTDVIIPMSGHGKQPII